MVQLDKTSECDPLDINLFMEHSTIDYNIFIQDNMYMPGDDVDTKTMLYHGSNMSCFQATAILVSWFSRFPGMSKNSFTQVYCATKFYLKKILYQIHMPTQVH